MTLAYLHVPKTGGMSLTRDLAKLGTSSPFTYYLREPEPNPIDKGTFGAWFPGRFDLGRYDILAGHGFYDSFRAGGAESFVTVLREPRTRLLSSYFYFRRKEGKIATRLPTSILDRHLFVGKDRVPLVEYVRRADVDANIVHHLIAPAEGGGAAAVIDRLAGFELVGFTERRREFVAALASLLGTQMLTNNAANMTHWREGFELGGTVGDLVEALDERTALDSEIYRWAVRHRHPGFSEPPHPDKTLARAMAKFRIT